MNELYVKGYEKALTDVEEMAKKAIFMPQHANEGALDFYNDLVVKMHGKRVDSRERTEQEESRKQIDTLEEQLSQLFGVDVEVIDLKGGE